MNSVQYNEEKIKFEINDKTGQLTALVLVSGLFLGLIHILGPISVIGIILFLTASVTIAFFHKCYHWIVMIGILMLSCVFIEPSPSDIILSAVIPLGLITGVYQPQVNGKALFAILIIFSHFIVSLPGIAFTSTQLSALRYILITFYLFLIAVFICTYARNDNITSMLRAYILAAFISFLAGLAGYLGFFSDLLMADAFRVKGLFKDPNVFGPFFVPAIILILDDMNRKSILKTTSIVHWAIVTMLTLGVVFSYSRAAWINLIVTLLAYFILNFKTFQTSQKIHLFISIIIVLAIVVGLFLSPIMSTTGITDFLQERAKLQNYDNDRFNAHHGGLELVSQNPFGYGAGQFEKEIVQIINIKIDAHSLYIRTAVENGILGFLLFFGGLLYIMLVLLFHHYTLPEKQKNKLSPSVLIAIICGLLVNSLVVDTIHWRHFWFFIGICLYCMRENREELY